MAAGLIALAACAAAQSARAPLQVRVVVVATFDGENATASPPGELQNWIRRYPLPLELPFAQGYRALRYNARDHVLGIVTGVGKSSAAASIMALGMDPRFDLRKAYWILAGIGGIDPNRASIGSAAWARYVVDGDLAYEIDAREMPADWSIGIVPYDRSTPFAEPAPAARSENGTLSYALNAALASWAYGLTREVALQDDDRLKAARAAYRDRVAAQRPPFVLIGDSLTADRFWIGSRMNDWAERWVAYWTTGQGRFTTSAEEDSAYLQALTYLARAGRADMARVLDLRTGSDYTVPPEGTSSAQLLNSEATGNYAAYDVAIENAFRVGSVVVHELSEHWPRYRASTPGANP